MPAARYPIRARHKWPWHDGRRYGLRGQVGQAGSDSGGGGGASAVCVMPSRCVAVGELHIEHAELPYGRCSVGDARPRRDVSLL